MAATDILTLPEAKAATAIGDDLHAGMLQQLISAVSQQLDMRCGPVVQRAIVSESHDGGSYSLRLNKTPIMVGGSASIVEYDRTTPTTLTLDALGTQNQYGFWIDRTGGVTRLNSGSRRLFPTGQGNIVVHYIAGRYTATSTVEAKWKQAAAMLVSNLYRNVYASGSDTYPMIQDSDLGMEPGVWVKAMAMLQREALAPYVG